MNFKRLLYSMTAKLGIILLILSFLTLSLLAGFTLLLLQAVHLNPKLVMVYFVTFQENIFKLSNVSWLKYVNIDVGDGCWTRNVLVTTWGCW